MRIGLMTRVLADPDLRARVTVHPASCEAAKLPAVVHGVLLCGCIGFFDAGARATLWQHIAACLAPAGAVLADVMTVQWPEPVAQMLVATAQVGTHRYDGWLDGTPEADDLMRRRMQFAQSDDAGTLRPLLGGALVARVEPRSTYRRSGRRRLRCTGARR